MIQNNFVSENVEVGHLTANPRSGITKYYGNVVRIWDPSTGKCVGIVAGSRPLSPLALTGLTLGGASALAFVNEDHSIGVWDAQTGELLRTTQLAFKSFAVSSLVATVGPDGRVALALHTWDEGLQILDLESGKILEHPARYPLRPALPR